MHDPETPQTAQLRWDDNNQPISSQFDDVYFSKADGLQETQYVFLEQNNLKKRWQTLDANSHFTIAETGFGTGLNFLATWKSWRDRFGDLEANKAPRLHFISVEKYPLSVEDLKRALQLWPSLNDLAQQLTTNYPPQPAQGTHRISFDNQHVTLTLLFDDAITGLQQLAPAAVNGEPAPLSLQWGDNPFYVDAWFLDGFAPAKNPEMWSPELFQAMATLSTAGTTFATFTAAGFVRRSLDAAGFEVFKHPGFARKREILKGIWQPTNREPVSHSPKNKKRGDAPRLFWHLQASAHHNHKNVAVIGGGLAGCHTAFALAQRNLHVTVFDTKQQLADAASGNRQGALYTKLSPHNNPLSAWNLAAQWYASHFYHSPTSSAAATFFEHCGATCGVLHVASNANQIDHFAALAQRYESSHFCRWLSASEASEVAGVGIHHPALFLPNSGWLSPKDLCRELCNHSNIQLKLGTPVEALHYCDGAWQIFGATGSSLGNFDAVVIANANDAKRFEQTRQLPLKTIRGQVTHIPQASPLGDALTNLKTVVCGDGYIAPAHRDQFCTGATFTLNDRSEALAQRCHEANLANLQSMLQFSKMDRTAVQSLDGRVGFRTTTPDYFPIVGPVPDIAAMQHRFARLRHKANADIDATGAFLPGLFTLVGLGSRGLAYAPLAAQIIAALVRGEPLPVAQQLYRHLHPARFVIRDLIRNHAS